MALDRPGYGASAPYPDAMADPEQRVALAYGAVDKILGDESPRRRSVSGRPTPPAASWRCGWPPTSEPSDASLLGVELAGTGCGTTPRRRRS